jgi:hypothetical protein
VDNRCGYRCGWSRSQCAKLASVSPRRRLGIEFVFVFQRLLGKLVFLGLGIEFVFVFFQQLGMLVVFRWMASFGLGMQQLQRMLGKLVFFGLGLFEQQLFQQQLVERHCDL